MLFYVLQKYGQVGLYAPLLGDFHTFPYYHLEPLTLADLTALDSVPEIPDRR